MKLSKILRELENLDKPYVYPKFKKTCGAKTRNGTPCKRKALANGRCPNHGGLSTGPKTKEGRERIAEAQRWRWIV